MLCTALNRNTAMDLMLNLNEAMDYSPMAGSMNWYQHV